MKFETFSMVKKSKNKFVILHCSNSEESPRDSIAGGRRFGADMDRFSYLYLHPTQQSTHRPFSRLNEITRFVFLIGSRNQAPYCERRAPTVYGRETDSKLLPHVSEEASNHIYVLL